MSKSFRPLVHAAIIAVLGLSIAACGPSKSPPPPPPGGGGGTVMKQEDQFGMAFANAFRADSNSEPYSPQDGDLVAASLTAEPATIN